MDILDRQSASISLISENDEAVNQQLTKIRRMQAELQAKKKEISRVLEKTEDLSRTLYGAADELKEHEGSIEAFEIDAEIQQLNKDFRTRVMQIEGYLDASMEKWNREIAQLEKLICTTKRGENPDVHGGGESRAVRGDLLTSLITSSRTLVGTLGLYIASIVWKEKTHYSGLYMAAMILFLYWTLFFCPIVKQYRILRRRHSTCCPELKDQLKVQMRTIDIKSICVAALTCIVLYRSLLMFEQAL